jgi:hypothetical protein
MDAGRRVTHSEIRWGLRDRLLLRWFGAPWEGWRNWFRRTA